MRTRLWPSVGSLWCPKCCLPPSPFTPKLRPQLAAPAPGLLTGWYLPKRSFHPSLGRRGLGGTAATTQQLSWSSQADLVSVVIMKFFHGKNTIPTFGKGNPSIQVCKATQTLFPRKQVRGCHPKTTVTITYLHLAIKLIVEIPN